MSMSNIACYSDTVSDDFVKEICMEEYQSLIDNLFEFLSLPEFAEVVQWDDLEDGIKEGIRIRAIVSIADNDIQTIVTSWMKLKEKFQSETGLELGMVYHEAQDGGDELDGYAFSVGNVYQYTPAGEKFKDKIERKFWTNFG